MMKLDEKINKYFAGNVVRKDLVKTVKGNAIVPSYVLEYLLGQYCATDDEDTIQSGIETVKNILKNHYVHRNEAGLIRSNIREKGRYKVIDKVFVELNEKTDSYKATFSNLGIKDVIIESAIIKKYPKMLVSGVWCIVTLEYVFNEDRTVSPWVLTALKPIQMSSFDYGQFIEVRKHFTKDEWINTLIQSIGFNPEKFGYRKKLLQLVRLIPYCERNYNLIELGPKGTGKSHIYTEFSPHGILISGGEVTVPKLFVNNQNGKLGLVGYWDCVAFDEFAGKEKKVNKAIVDIMKNYMANKSFSRGIETLGAEASMAFVGNTKHTVPYMLKHSDLFDELPLQYHDSAFLDRIHFYIPGWEIDIIRGEMFSTGYGFVVDYIAEVLKYLRNEDYSNKYKKYFELSSDISTRDRDGIHKTFSGLMKILYPSGEATKDEIEEILKFAIEGRKRVKDQLMRIDSTYADTDFSYIDLESGKNIKVYTLEEKEYPNLYKKRNNEAQNKKEEENKTENKKPEIANDDNTIEKAKEQHLEFMENQKGVTYNKLFANYIKGATKITITDPYIRIFFQIRNLMEFIETIIANKSVEDIVKLHLITIADEIDPEKQLEYFQKIKDSVQNSGVIFTWEFDETKTIHARSIVTNTGWKILLDRGLDIFQPYDMNDTFNLANRMQEYRGCKAFDVTYIKNAKSKSV
jgi:ATP-dependent Lon protease